MRVRNYYGFRMLTDAVLRTFYKKLNFCTHFSPFDLQISIIFRNFAVSLVKYRIQKRYLR